MQLFEDLEARGLIKQTNNKEKLRSLLNDAKITFYLGIDPTAPSLHVGHLLPLVTAKRLIQAGHHCIVLIGDATARIGDPSGKTSARKVLREDVVSANATSITLQVLDIVERQNVFIDRNAHWFQNLSYLDFLDWIAPDFSVNQMLRAECFRSRMEHGLSLLEFNYMAMQAYDFYSLFKDEDCILQIGGDDQWSNMLAGVDLIHKKTGKESFVITLPLLVNSDGTKMGKTEKGAVWLSNDPFEFYQFWRNIPDSEIEKCYKYFSFRPIKQINWCYLGTSSALESNVLKKELAFEITKMVHGKEKAERARTKSENIYERHDLNDLDTFEFTPGVQLLDALVQSKLAKSKTEARNLIANGGIYLNNVKVEDPLMILNKDCILRKGKKQYVKISTSSGK